MKAICTNCGPLPVSSFSKNRRMKNGLQRCCKTCCSRYYKEHRETMLPKARQVARTKIAEIRSIIREAKSKPCTDCGQTYNYWQMDLDHVTGKKCFNISEAVPRMISGNKLLNELNKCEPVCANCHRNRTHERAGALLVP